MYARISQNWSYVEAIRHLVVEVVVVAGAAAVGHHLQAQRGRSCLGDRRASSTGSRHTLKQKQLTVLRTHPVSHDTAMNSVENTPGQPRYSDEQC